MARAALGAQAGRFERAEREGLCRRVGRVDSVAELLAMLAMNMSSYVRALLSSTHCFPPLSAHARSSVELHMWGYPVLLTLRFHYVFNIFNVLFFKTFQGFHGRSRPSKEKKGKTAHIRLQEVGRQVG